MEDLTALVKLEISAKKIWQITYRRQITVLILS